uniref:PIH1D1/2/3 CS-like domain-containing protein n=1 Tax=Polytomella parva TaxID=51329 RepID=A0A7S0VNV5_9CHLO|mmetsp:Transcript_8140/g.15741  ORF Transcript_8140/g.15741 Transcript_8140/m.15741 type:complete len:394 (+) Transcript_8140:196-1377(+)
MANATFVTYPFHLPSHISEYIKLSNQRLYKEETWPPTKTQSDRSSQEASPASGLNSPSTDFEESKKKPAKGFNFSKSLKGIKSEAGTAVLSAGDGSETVKVQDTSFGGQRARVVHLAPHALQDNFAEKTLAKLDMISKESSVPHSPAPPRSNSSTSASERVGREVDDPKTSIGDMAKLFSSLNSIGASPSSLSSTASFSSSTANPKPKSSYASVDPNSMLCDLSSDQDLRSSPSNASSSSSKNWGKGTSLVGSLRSGSTVLSKGPCPMCGHTCSFVTFGPSNGDSESGSRVWNHYVREGAEVLKSGGKKAGGKPVGLQEDTPDPKAVQVVVMLPESVTTVRDVNFILGLKHFEISVPSSGKLKIELPYCVDEDTCTANFSKAKHRLTVATVRK